MNINKARKCAMFTSIASLLLGTFFILCTAVNYFTIQDRFERILDLQQPSPKTVFYLVKACKSLIFGVCPALCVILITMGVCVLNYLRKERKANDQKNHPS